MKMKNLSLDPGAMLILTLAACGRKQNIRKGQRWSHRRYREQPCLLEFNYRANVKTETVFTEANGYKVSTFYRRSGGS